MIDVIKPILRVINQVKGNVDKAAQLQASMKRLSNMQVYVGVPEEKTGRKAGPVTNAQLLYIHTNGSPIQGIPVRAVIEPAIEAPENKKAITEELAQAARAAINGKEPEAKQHLRLAGMTGQNAARAWFTDPQNGWAPNSLETARSKALKATGKAKERLNEHISAGGAVTDVEISRPMIDTAQLRKSITYVVKE